MIKLSRISITIAYLIERSIWGGPERSSVILSCGSLSNLPEVILNMLISGVVVSYLKFVVVPTCIH